MSLLKLIDSAIDISLVFCILCIILARFLPDFENLFKYGKASLDDELLKKDKLYWLVNLRVAKSSFWHFYLYSCIELAIIIYSVQLHYNGDNANLLHNKFFIILLLSSVQSLRRLYECLYVNVKSNSKLHVLHYLVGIYFYMCVNLNNWTKLLIDQSNHAYNRDSSPSKSQLWFLLILFTLAYLDQTRNHLYLRTLVKYNQPIKGLFKFAASAHYFDEILIYVSHWIILQNFTSVLILLWVVVTLGISATDTYNYYKSKDNFVAAKYKIIPFIY